MTTVTVPAPIRLIEFDLSTFDRAEFSDTLDALAETIRELTVDIEGIAELADRAKETVMTWRRRSLAARREGRGDDSRLLPTPDGFTSGAPWWLTARIILWLNLTGRT